jgi:prolyl-tRNA synthetase
MKISELFPKTMKEAPKDADSINHKLLVRAGFIDQLMAGSWTLLPLGLRVINKINQVIREEMNAIGGQEMLMPLMTPKNLWDETGRWDTAKQVMYQFADAGHKQYGLAFTHEEVVMDLLRKKIKTYRDLPLYLYHFSTKFRSEARARSGILRGREFLMKDLYSAHTSEQDLMVYYEKVKDAYAKIFKRLGFSFKITEAAGGVFTDNYTHEFQVPSQGGEDTIFYCDHCGWGQNKEIFKGKVSDECPKCRQGKLAQTKSIEVGYIFPLGKWFAEKMNVSYVDKKGVKQPVWFGSYGIGPTRVLGAWVEVSHDDHGIIWNKAMSPFDVHLVELPDGKNADEIYAKLKNAGFAVLWDDRDLVAGQKFADADLIGTPVRLVVSGKTKEKIEWKNRNSDKTELLSLAETINRLKG